MHSHDEKPPYIPEPGKRYETDEVTYPVIGKSAAALIGFFIANLALASLGYYLFVYRATVHPKHIFDATPKAQEANVPILQKDPIGDIHRFRAEEYRVEHAYEHWTDGDGKQSLRIPIERALAIVKEKGLPAPKQSAVQPVPAPGQPAAAVPGSGGAPGAAPMEKGMTAPAPVSGGSPTTR
jgi:hypothetical protein